MGTEIESVQGEISHKLGWYNLYSIIFNIGTTLTGAQRPLVHVGDGSGDCACNLPFCFIGSVLSLHK